MKNQSHQDNLSAKWIQQHQVTGTTSEEALRFFDCLAPIDISEMIGSWQGSELPTGHPLDGLLVATGWYGKEFVSFESVYPLLFTVGKNKRVHLDSRYLPSGLMARLTPAMKLVAVKLFPLLRGMLSTHQPQARLRMVEYRQKLSATMIYDFLPIHDVFRRIDSNSVLGLMDQRGQHQPFFFVLRREDKNDV